MPIERTLSEVIPYGHITGEGEIDLRGLGRLVGYTMGGLSPEASMPAEVDAYARQLAAALRHFGTGDMIHCIYHRLPAREYPHLDFPSEAAREIDAERRHQFEEANFWTTLRRLYVTHAYEGAFKGRARAAIFSSEQAAISAETQWRFFLPHLNDFEDATANVLKLKRMDSTTLFRDLILCVTGRTYPALPPANSVRLNEIVASDVWYGGVAPWTGDLHMRPICVTAYPTETVPHMMQAVLHHPGQMTLSIRFLCQDPQDTQEQLKLERTFWVRENLGTLVDMFCKALHIPRRPTINQDSERQIAEMDEAIAEAASGLQFGWCTIVITVVDSDPELATFRARQVLKDLSALGFNARIEDANASEAIFGSWPGDGWHNIRRPMISSRNWAELALPVEYYVGTPNIDSPFFA